MLSSQPTYPSRSPEFMVVTAAANYTEGQWVSVNGNVGIVAYKVSSGADALLMIQGQYKVPCDSADVLAIGDLVYCDSNGKAQPLIKGVKPNAVCLGASASGSTTVHVLLLPHMNPIIDAGNSAFVTTGKNLEVNTILSTCLAAVVTALATHAADERLWCDKVITAGAITVQREAATPTSGLGFSYVFIGY